VSYKGDKVVFTKTLARSVWENTILAKGNLVDEVLALKRVSGKIYCVGGEVLPSSLIEAGLVDEFHLMSTRCIRCGIVSIQGNNSSLELHFIEAIPLARYSSLKYEKKSIRSSI